MGSRRLGRFDLILAGLLAACTASPPAAADVESKRDSAATDAAPIKQPSELEQRVLGVRAHVNVTRTYGISEYRRLMAYLRTVDGVVGVSPFVYFPMDLAPVVVAGDAHPTPRTTVLVKGIDPDTAGGVLDLVAHLDKGGSPNARISSLRSDRELQPMLDHGKSADVIESTPDPRGDTWYEPALARWQRNGETIRDETQDDVTLPTMFVGVELADEIGVAAGDIVTLGDPKASADNGKPRRFRIAGTFVVGVEEFDRWLIYVHIRELQWFKYEGRDIIAGVDLRLTDAYDAPAVRTLLQETLADGDYKVDEWQTLHADLLTWLRNEEARRAEEDGPPTGVGLEECWELSFSRLQKCDGFLCLARVMSFAEECSANARPSPEFCNQLPKDDAVAYVRFIFATCAERGEPTEACHKTLKWVFNGCRRVVDP